MMDRADILKKVNEIICDVFDDDDIQLTESMTSEDVDEWDSVNHVRLMIALEAAFGIRFETDEITQPRDVGALVSLVEEKSRR